MKTTKVGTNHGQIIENLDDSGAGKMPTMVPTPTPSMPPERRDALKKLGVSGAFVTAANWTAPVVTAVSLPVHGATTPSGCIASCTLELGEGSAGQEQNTESIPGIPNSTVTQTFIGDYEANSMTITPVVTFNGSCCTGDIGLSIFGYGDGVPVPVVGDAEPQDPLNLCDSNCDQEVGCNEPFVEAAYDQYGETSQAVGPGTDDGVLVRVTIPAGGGPGADVCEWRIDIDHTATDTPTPTP